MGTRGEEGSGLGDGVFRGGSGEVDVLTGVRSDVIRVKYSRLQELFKFMLGRGAMRLWISGFMGEMGEIGRISDGFVLDDGISLSVYCAMTGHVLGYFHRCTHLNVTCLVLCGDVIVQTWNATLTWQMRL
jgi:hypothetical protein